LKASHQQQLAGSIIATDSRKNTFKWNLCKYYCTDRLTGSIVVRQRVRQSPSVELCQQAPAQVGTRYYQSQ